MAKYVVVGAGATGTGVARQLAERGDEVVVLTRRGGGPQMEGVRLVAGDATDPRVLSELATGSSALFNCANPPYHRWASDWPPIANSLLAAAKSSGATLITLSNLYVYGQPHGPMRASDPMDANYEKAQVRAKMWRDALALHDAGTIRASEVRASDFVGPVANSMLGDRVVPRILKGKTVQVIGNPDAAHSWTYVGDVCTTLVAVADEPSAWGRPWHVATNEPRSSRQAIDDLADAAGVARVKVRSVPRSMLVAAGWFSPMMRELPKTLYQFEDTFVIDDTDTREILGLTPTPWATVLAAQLEPFESLATIA